MSRFSLVPRLVLVAVLAAAAAGCATDQPQRRHGHWRQGGERRGGEERGGGVSLFISPAGQPFRAAQDDAYPSAAWFKAADADHDGRLTRAELRADAERFFHQIDLNGDGKIDGTEVTAYEHDVVPEIVGNPGAQASDGARPSGGGWGGGQGGGRHHGGGRGRMGGGGSGSGASGGQASRAPLQGAAPYTLNRQSEPVSAADTDFDGKVTLAEFLAAADRHFGELDASGAGYLTLEGLPKTLAQQRRGRRSPTPG